MENLTEELIYVAKNVWRTSEITTELETLAEKYERSFGEVAEEYGNICDELDLM
jgi:hypothetical protein